MRRQPSQRLQLDVVPRGGDLGRARSRWVPQGLGYYRKRDWMLVSWYDKNGEEQSIIGISRRSNSGRVKTLRLPVSR